MRLRLAESLPDGYADMAETITAALATRIVALRERLGRPVIIGLSGAQGSGKTTLALFLANWLQHEEGLTSVRLSLDDLYFGKQMRAVLARSIHPLLVTRGVPGTHDIELAKRTLDALTDTSGPDRVSLPVFDKASDDRVRVGAGPVVVTPVDVVVFEGWCIGARAQAAEELADPVNALEADGDPTGAWRRYVNERLRQEYAALFRKLDALVMLRVPSFDKVFEWRVQQERQLGGRGQSDAELAEFIMHYERLTRHMLATMPDYADTVIDIDAEHRMVASSHRGW